MITLNKILRINLLSIVVITTISIICRETLPMHPITQLTFVCVACGMQLLAYNLLDLSMDARLAYESTKNACMFVFYTAMFTIGYDSVFMYRIDTRATFSYWVTLPFYIPIIALSVVSWWFWKHVTNYTCEDAKKLRGYYVK